MSRSDLIPAIFSIKFREAKKLGGHNRSVDPSAPSILQPRVRIPSTTFVLDFHLYLDCGVKRTNINKKIGPF